MQTNNISINLQPQNLQGLSALVLGSGYSGLVMARWLHDWGVNIQVVDSRKNPPNKNKLKELGVNVEVVDFNNPPTNAKEYFNAFDFIAISPGIALKEKIVQAAINCKVKIVSEIELFLQAIEQWSPLAKVLGITGSNGKTTVTSLLGLMLRENNINCAVAGNIAPSALDKLLELNSQNNLPDVWVLELSSFQLATTYKLNNRVFAGTVLNFSDNHQDWHVDRQDYFNCKAGLLEMSNNVLINADDEQTILMAKQAGAKKTTTFSTKNPKADYYCNESDGFIYAQGNKIINRQVSALVGNHNSSNILSALALASFVGLEAKKSSLVLSKFTGIDHRMQLVKSIDGVDFINDSKSTTVAATVAAVLGIAQGQSRKIILIVGGIGKNQNFDDLAEPINNRVKNLILVGRDAQIIKSTILQKLKSKSETPNQTVNVSIDVFDNLQTPFTEILDNVYTFAKSDDCVLLSPACSSFDMFSNYEERGKVFCDWVNNIKTSKMEVNSELR